MSFFDNIPGFSKKQEPAQQQQQPNQQQQTSQNSNTSANQEGNNNQNQNPGAGGNNQNSGNQPPKHAMDDFNGLWDTPKDGDKAPTFTLDDKTLGDVASKQDFMQGMDPALLERANTGDMKAVIEMMNHVGRNAYRSALGHGSMLTDKFVSAREGFNEKSLPNKVRKELTNHALADTPNFAHPVVRKQLTMIADNLQAQHPDAQPAEIAKMAKKYLTELSAVINPAKEQKAKPGAVGSTNWDEFIDAEDASDSDN